jgi:dihydroorotate dehydrogenase (fumarate)
VWERWFLESAVTNIKEKIMINFATTYAGMTLKNPLIVGSSTLTGKVEKNREFEQAGAGAIVLKSLFEEQIGMYCDSFMHSLDAPEAADYIEHYAKSQQIEEYLTLIKETKTACSIPVIASINCYRAEVWADYARLIEDAGADALELNIFFLFTELDFSFDAAVRLYSSILQKVRKQLKIPVIVKIGKNFSNIPALANILKSQGADGIVLFNRYYQTDINIQKEKIVAGRLYSSHVELSDTLRWTALVAGKVPGLSISSSTGIHDWPDVIKCLMAGASAAQLCSAIYIHGPEIITKMLSAIHEWMKQKKYRAVSEFIGKLRYDKLEDHTLYERCQFMKYYSERH